jgi:hypothetical protein
MRLIVCALLMCSCVFMSGASDHRDGPITITRCEFDTVNLVVRLSWVSDSTIVNEGVDVGIAASCIPGERPRPATSFRCTSLSADTVFAVENAVFDTVYTISIWTKRLGEWTPPDSSAMHRVRIASSVRQPVSYFSSATHDTVKALAGRLLLWKGPDFPAGILPTFDTVEVCSVPDSALQGFVPVGAAIRFLHPAPSPAFFLALTYADVAAGRGAPFYRLYKDSLGSLVVQGSAVLDSVNKRIVIKTFDISYPYQILSDTVRPLTRVLSDTSRPIDTIQQIDSFSVVDNSVNITWAFYRAAGGQAYSAPIASGLLGARTGRIFCAIPAIGAQAAGVRAFLTVSDGVYLDTIDISRRAVRLHSDAATTPMQSIVPIVLTAEPDNPDIRFCLKDLFSLAGGAYDRSVFRIFRWLPSGGNSGKPDKWVEYPSDENAAFACRPGALFWLITNQSLTIDFGRSRTISLKSPYAVRLSPHNWTDFGVPFGFDVSLSGVISASGPSAEKLVIYRWQADNRNRTYRPELVYGGSALSGNSVSDTLFSGSSVGYTVYNPSGAEADLIFPPLPVSMTDQEQPGILPKSAEENMFDFSVKVSAFVDTTKVSTIHCGVQHDQGDSLLIPSPPSFSSATLVAKRPDGSEGAILLYPPKGREVSCYPISFVNKGDRPASARILASLVRSGRETLVRLAKIAAGGYEILPDNFEVTTASGGRDDFLVVVGPKELVAAFLAGAPSQARTGRSPSISYRLRNGLPVISFGELFPGALCRVSIFDLRGKRISLVEMRPNESSQGNVEIVSPRVPPGMFVCKSSVGSGAAVRSETRFIMVPK